MGQSRVCVPSESVYTCIQSLAVLRGGGAPVVEWRAACQLTTRLTLSLIHVKASGTALSARIRACAASRCPAASGD